VAPRSHSIRTALPRLHGLAGHGPWAMGMVKVHFGNGSKSLRRVAGGRSCYHVENKYKGSRCCFSTIKLGRVGISVLLCRGDRLTQNISSLHPVAVFICDTHYNLVFGWHVVPQPAPRRWGCFMSMQAFRLQFYSRYPSPPIGIDQ
jgi:hypothetical protein